MRGVLALVVLVACAVGAVAEAQTVYVSRGGRLVAVPLEGLAAADPTAALPAPAEGGLLRVDGLPPGAVLAIDGRPLGGAAELAGGFILLAPGPHFVEVALPGGQAIRFTVLTPVERSGYQVVPRP